MKNTPNVLGDDSLGFWRGGDISYHRDVNPSSSIEKQSHQTSLLSNNIQLALHIARQILQFFAMNTPCKSNKTSGLLLVLVLRATVMKISRRSASRKIILSIFENVSLHLNNHDAPYEAYPRPRGAPPCFLQCRCIHGTKKHGY